MKLAVLLAGLLVSSMAFGGAKNYEVKIKKGDMHCKDCADNVSKALQSLPEVDKGSVKVILAKNTATLQVKDGAKVSADEIKKTIEKQGYTVTSVEEIKTK